MSAQPPQGPPSATPPTGGTPPPPGGTPPPPGGTPPSPGGTPPPPGTTPPPGSPDPAPASAPGQPPASPPAQPPASQPPSAPTGWQPGAGWQAGSPDSDDPATATGAGDGPPTPPAAPSDGDEGAGRNWGMIIAAVIGVVVLGGGAAFAWNLIAGSDDDLVARVPADATFYAHVNLDPNAENKLGLVSLRDRIEEASGEELPIDDMLAEIGRELEAEGTSWEEIDAWLGRQFAVWGTVPEGAGLDALDDVEDMDADVPFALLLELDDEALFREFITAQSDDPPTEWTAADGTTGWSDDDMFAVVSDDVLVIGSEAGVNATLEVETALPDNEAYAAAMGALPEGVASFWFNAEDLLEQQGTEGFMTSQAAGVLSFADASLNFSVVVPTADESGELIGTAPLELGEAPADGQAYFRVPDLGARIRQTVTAVEDAMGQAGGNEDPVAQADQVLAEFDTSFDELTGWMGDLTIAVGYRPQQATDNFFLDIDLGTSDPDATRALLNTSLEQVPADPSMGIEIADGSATMGDMTVEVLEDRLQWAIGEGSGALNDMDSFPENLDGMQGEPMMYVDIRGIVEAVAPALGGDMATEDVQKGMDIAGAFDFVAATVATNVDGWDRSDMRVSWASDYEPVNLGGDMNPPDVDLGLGTFEELMGQGMGPGPDPTEPTGPDTGGQAYGDDPELDALYDACEGGDMEACDSLWLEAPVGSEYSSFGTTCGDRVEFSFDCVGDVGQGANPGGGNTEPTTPPTEGNGGNGGGNGGNGGGQGTAEPNAYGDDAELDSLWDACEGGDGAACDDLFLQSPIGSEYEDFGYSCGGKRGEATDTCANVLG